MPDTQILSVQDRAAAIQQIIEEGWNRFIVRERERGPKEQHHSYVRASAWRPCTRRMVYEMLATPKKPWTPEQLANFRRGDDRERNLMRDLQEVGRDADPPFRVSEQQTTVRLKDHQGRDVIVGHCDGMLDFYTLEQRFPLEVKSWSQNIVARIKTFQDVMNSPWTRGGAYQLLAYLYGHGEPLGFFLLDRHGLPSLLPVELESHLREMEDFLQQATDAADYAELNQKLAEDDLALPPYIQDAAECRRCPFFGSVCNPPLDYGQGAAVLQDEELHAALERWNELKPAAEEYDDLDATIKEKLRGVELGLAGNFLVEGKWSALTKYDIPKAVKEQYKAVVEKGQFRLKITKV